jgi:hypothetical protein
MSDLWSILLPNMWKSIIAIIKQANVGKFVYYMGPHARLLLL